MKIDFYHAKGWTDTCKGVGRNNLLRLSGLCHNGQQESDSHKVGSIAFWLNISMRSKTDDTPWDTCGGLINDSSKMSTS